MSMSDNNDAASIKQGTDALEKWMTYLEMQKYAPGTMDMYRSVILNAIMIIKKPLEDWVNSDVTAFLKQTEKEFNNRRKVEAESNFQGANFTYQEYKTRTKLMKTNAIRSFMRFLQEDRIIKECGIKFHKNRDPVDTRFKNRVPHDIIEKWFAQLPRKKSYIILYFQLLQGLRISEVLKMRFGWIDWIKKDGAYWLNVIGKRNKKRTIPIDKIAFEILYDYIMEYVFKINVRQIDAKIEKQAPLSATEQKLYTLIHDHDPILFIETEQFSLKDLQIENVFKSGKVRSGLTDAGSNVIKTKTYKELTKDLDPRVAFKMLAPYKTPCFFHQTLQRLNEQLNIPAQNNGRRYTTHANRGNCLTFHSEMGMPLAGLVDLAGHSDPKTTMNYIASNQEKLQQEFEQSSFIQKKPKELN